MDIHIYTPIIDIHQIAQLRTEHPTSKSAQYAKSQQQTKNITPGKPTSLPVFYAYSAGYT
jgi:hypothetical protein